MAPKKKRKSRKLKKKIKLAHPETSRRDLLNKKVSVQWVDAVYKGIIVNSDGYVNTVLYDDGDRKTYVIRDKKDGNGVVKLIGYNRKDRRDIHTFTIIDENPEEGGGGKTRKHRKKRKPKRRKTKRRKTKLRKTRRRKRTRQRKTKKTK